MLALSLGRPDGRVCECLRGRVVLFDLCFVGDVGMEGRGGFGIPSPYKPCTSHVGWKTSYRYDKACAHHTGRKYCGDPLCRRISANVL